MSVAVTLIIRPATNLFCTTLRMDPPKKLRGVRKVGPPVEIYGSKVGTHVEIYVSVPEKKYCRNQDKTNVT
jgi:hypothetical protein